MIDTTNMGIMANLIQPTSNVMANHMISKKDSDSSSTLSVSEMGIDSEAFTSYDLDADGSLTLSELTTAIDTAMSQFDGEMPSKEDFQSVLSQFGFEPPNSSSNSLSSSQQDTIASVLENYDASNLSKSDALEIVAAFKEAGIQPGAELETAMAEAGFDAHEVGTLAGVGPQGQAGGGGAPAGGGGGSSGGGDSSASSENYDVMDLNEDGVVSFAEMQEYYGQSGGNTSNQTSSNEQNTLDTLQVLMETLKANSNGEPINTNSFDGILRAINNQNSNSEINTFLQSSNNTSSLFGYA